MGFMRAEMVQVEPFPVKERGNWRGAAGRECNLGTEYVL